MATDLAQLGASGYQAADWLRASRRIDVGISDHRRIEATMSMADDEATAQRLLGALEALVRADSSMRTVRVIQA
ncbi:hypothetical protein HER39_13660 [Arthrobacter deserti]|uniref:Uncharacterized protein n=1 Tax=Arthrobacter deserti TaxID=1742687 RepID=A0ABX1JQS9_9MICC|nr:hypothetical protein [Arthrobacter deserti]